MYQKWVQEIMAKLSQTKLACYQTSGVLIMVGFGVWDYMRWEEAVVVFFSKIVFKVSTDRKVEFLHNFLHV